MGKKIHNAKARQNPKTIIDNSETKNIQVDFGNSINEISGYDDANALALPSKKRATKVHLEQRKNIKILTKKQRKHLQTIVNRKQKKEQRASVLEALSKVQIPKNELQKYASISQVQTLGLKKLHTLEEYVEKAEKKKTQRSEIGRVSSIAGVSKRKRMALLAGYGDAESDDDEDDDGKSKTKKKKNLNVIGLEESESSGSDGDADDDDDDQEQMESGGEHKEVEKKNEQKVEDMEVDTVEKLSATTKEIVSVTKVSSKPSVFIPVDRDPEIQATRLKLPILAEEQEIMETINENSIIIIAGETGSGKTTQVPQFLYESGYAEKKMIGITEPRRVAAIAMSKRVAREMNLSEKEVSYLIRFEGNVTEQTRIKFMTDGVLMKEIETDFLLSKYSVIILDEAHERSAYTDILIGLLSRIVPLRLKRGNPLKLIIMSATLRIEDFTNNSRLFRTPPPLIKVEARQYPVTIHFQKHTMPNYIDEAFKKTVKIHAKLPEGGILIFVTGQKEVNQLVRKLQKTFPYVASDCKNQKSETKRNDEKQENEVNEGKNKISDIEDENEIEFDMRRAIRKVKKSKKKFLQQIALPKINLDDYKLPTDDTEADLHEADNDLEFDDYNDAADGIIGNDEDDDDFEGQFDNDTENMFATKQPLWVLPLYSLLSTEKQNRIFQPIPDGCRLCVVSTNVAETSLTIPNIKYVVDSGRQKTRIYDKITGVSAFVVTYTSKASANQRAGRAGRISAGHCYRLYSSAVFNDEFEDFSIPDIQRKPVDDLMLQMRAMGIDRVRNFPFPSPPDPVQLEAAEKRLIVLGALDEPERPNDEKAITSITKLGRVITRFPVAPRFGKMLALSHQQSLLPYTVCIVSALSVQEVLDEESGNRENETTSNGVNKWQRRRQSWAASGHYELLGDPMVLLRAVGAAEYAGFKGKLQEFCSVNGLRPKAIAEIRKLRKQITNEINLHVSNVDLCVNPEMQPPTDLQAKFLRQILLAGMGDRVAHKIPLDEIKDPTKRREMKYAYNCLDMEEPVFIHSCSVLKHKTPEWIIFQEAYEIQNGDSTKMFLRGITAIEPEWLPMYVPKLCNIRNIQEDPAPKYNQNDGKVYCMVEATFGKAGWDIPATEIEMPISEKACCYLAMFFLNGDICPKLNEFKPKLKTTPSSVVRSWSDLNQNVAKFKRAFVLKKINTRQKLFDEWKTNPNFLLELYCNLLYDVSQSELLHIWPPMEIENS